MTVKQIHIEKYDFDAFEKEQKPFVMIRTEVIQNFPIKKSQEYLLWSYLESLPATWKPNKSHLTKHFDIGDRTYERYMSWLNSVGLIEYRQNRLPDGSFGKGRLVVLNGENFNPSAASSRTVKIGGAVVVRLKQRKLSTENLTPEQNTLQPSPRIVETTVYRTAKLPLNGQAVERSNVAHIKTTIKEKKEVIKKTNNKSSSVSVFSDTDSVKNHIEMVIANRQDPVDDEIINQGVFYAFTKNQDKNFDSVNKLINVFLKMVRDGRWLIPQGYNDISSQSIRANEHDLEKIKQEQYAQEAKAFRKISGQALSNQPYIKLADRLAAYQAGLLHANS